MKRLLIYLSALVVVIVLWGVWDHRPVLKQTEVAQPVSFTNQVISGAPKAVQDLAARNRDKESASGIVDAGNVYILITRGLQPTAGYGVEISGIYMENVENKPLIIINLKYTNPQPGQMTAQVLTYPMAAAKLNLKRIPQGLSFVFHKQPAETGKD